MLKNPTKICKNSIKLETDIFLQKVVYDKNETNIKKIESKTNQNSKNKEDDLKLLTKLEISANELHAEIQQFQKEFDQFMREIVSGKQKDREMDKILRMIEEENLQKNK